MVNLVNGTSKPSCSKNAQENGDTPNLWGLGKIVSLHMKDFITYSNCTVNFDPCLNVIMGPNGTGKSSIVCAICLALNGKASILGRSKDERDYINYGCESCAIQIELFNTDGPNFTIKRTISRGTPKNKWWLNGEAARADEIDMLKIQLKIRIDNLCQFLPQDRVQAFSSMSDAARLQDSMNAIEPELCTKHEKLKELTGTSSDFQAWKTKIDELIVTLENRKNSMEPAMDEMKERKKLESRKALLEKKKMFLMYDIELREFEVLREKKRELDSKMEERENTLKPLENELRVKREVLNEQQKDVSKWSKKVADSLRLQQLMSQNAEQFLAEQDQVNNAFHQKEKDEKKRHEIIQNLKDEISLTRTKLATECSLSSEQASERLQEIEKRMEELIEKERPLNGEVKRLEVDHQMCKSELVTLNGVMKSYQNRVLHKENQLRQLNPDVYRAYKYLQEHEHEIKHDFSYPMFLSLTVTDQSKIRQVENHIQNRDLLSFVFTDAHDLDLFSSIVNGRMNLKVSSILAPPKEEAESLSREKLSPDLLSSLGCQGVLIDFIEAPSFIKAYLQKYYMFHKTPVGKQFNNAQVEMLLQKFPIFYSDESRFQAKKSKYMGGQISTSESMLRDCRFLKDTIDLDQRMLLEEQIVSKKRQEVELQRELEQLLQNLNSSRARRETLSTERSRILQSEKIRKKLEAQIDVKVKNLNDLKSRHVDWQTSFTEAMADFEKSRNEKLVVLNRMNEGIEELLNHSSSGLASQLKLDIAAFGVRLGERELKSERDNIVANTKEINELEEKKDNQKLKTRQRWCEALKFCGLDATLKSIPNDLSQTFDNNNVPQDLESVEQEINELTRTVENMNPVDEATAVQYAKITNKLSDLANQKESRCESQEAHEAVVRDLKSEWLTKVKSFVERLNENFSRFMSEMNCSGRVELSTKSEDDFFSYGLSIKVSYRAEDAVQELKREYQSGGEKSVATMLYLLALQELSSDVPFRIVDEINQGMDCDNERKVFNMIVEAVTSTNRTSQYLFVTPKLLLDLEYKPNMRVLTVLNGSFNQISSEKWKISRFIRRHKKFSQAWEDESQTR